MNSRNLIVDFGGAIHCYEMILVHSLDIVLGNKDKVVPSFYHQYFTRNHPYKLLEFKHKGHCSGNHGNHNN